MKAEAHERVWRKTAIKLEGILHTLQGESSDVQTAVAGAPGTAVGLANAMADSYKEEAEDAPD